AAYDSFAEIMQTTFSSIKLYTAESILSGDIPDEDIIIAVTENYPLPGVDFDKSTQPQVVEALHTAHSDRLIVAALRDPYELIELPDIQTYVCGFSFRPCTAQALVDVLSGDVEAVGRTPVSW
ncbi:MAG: hypothetical protein ACPG7F_10620, partial [Aggregatilineales bacterium]